MIKEAICTGATIDEARHNALAQLNAPEDADVNTEVIDLPVKKKFGLFGGAPAKVRAFYTYEENPVQEAVDYLTKILSGIGVENPGVTYKKENDGYLFDIACGEKHGTVIGRRGETLDALQYLVSLVLNKDSEKYIRLTLNVGDYREKRALTLKSVAAKNAKQVLRTGRKVTLEPMNPYERRMIHTAIQDIEGVSSHSVGSDMDRRVVITSDSAPKGGNKPRPRKKRPVGQAGGKPPVQKTREPKERKPLQDPDPPVEMLGKFGEIKVSVETQPDRPHHSDLEEGALYGKIEPKV